MALLLDIANILGGLLLAVPLVRQLPAVGYDIGKFADRIGRWAWLIGVLALVAGGYYLIVHLFSGPHVFHFEVVGIGVGVALLWDRLTGRKPLDGSPATGGASAAGGHGVSGPGAGGHGAGGHGAGGHGPGGPGVRSGGPSGRALLLAVFGVIAIVVGIQGLFTPN
ncbi:hypothetical protein [Actinoplanes sp. GCM10030250]|uniref:hypothetical protein n=1 Tax=Actinoplanes sp. GCM10030250 TaxID=3273376 RepID=UPI0036089854